VHTTGRYGSTQYPAKNKRVLVIDDDVELCEMLCNFLDRRGWEVHAAHTGKRGLELAYECRADLILLDLILPDWDGFELLRRLQRERFVPVLIVSGKCEESDRVVGIELGADDYLTKPFSVRELLARMGAVLRRSSFRTCLEFAEPFVVGEFTVDASKREVLYGTYTLGLTQIEFQLFRIFLLRPYDLLSREELTRGLFERPTETLNRNLDMHILRLRRKLKSIPDFGGAIRTIRSEGYIFVLHAVKDKG